MTENTTTAIQRFVLCTSCGSPEFERIVQEDATIVRLIEQPNGSIVDDVIREGEQQFVSRCTKCDSELNDVEITATGDTIGH